MKKLLSLIFVSLLFSGNGHSAEEMTIKSLLDEGYKITKEELVKFDRYAQNIFTLKKLKQVKICTVRIINVTGVSSLSKCMTP